MIRKKESEGNMVQDTQGAFVDRYPVRFPHGLRDRLKKKARQNTRSMHAEIISILLTAVEQHEQDRIAATTSVVLPATSQDDLDEICGLKSGEQIPVLTAKDDLQIISARDRRAYQRQFCRLTFLKRNEGGFTVVCQETDGWETCTVGPASVLSTYGEQSFSTTETYQRDALLHLLEQAYERGRADKAREIRTVLEIPR